MKTFCMNSLNTILFTATIIFTGVVVSNIAQAETKVIKIDGSSTVFPITEAVAEEFQRSTKDTRVTVGISGTGGGFKKFCRGEIDVQDASRPILKSEMEACKKEGVQYIELPVAFDALTIVVHPSNNWMKAISFLELKSIWKPEAQTKILKWNQVNKAWPNEPLRLFGAGADSGTFDYFTEAINGKAKSSRGDYTASEDDNTLVQGVSQDKSALGYVPFAYYEANKTKIKALPLLAESKEGKEAVAPSVAAVKEGRYPLSRPLFIYVSAKSLLRKEVSDFVNFYLSNAADLASQVQCVALPVEAYRTGLQHLKAKKLGTVFAGEQKIGMSIEEVLKKEAAL